MLDFRPRVKARNYLSRREQRRLAWVMGIGLVVIACASFAEIRQFLRTRSISAVQSIDTRFQPQPSGSSQPDAVTIVKTVEPAAANDVDATLESVNAEVLTTVADDTPWIRTEEIDAWLHLWRVLQRSNDDELARRSTGIVGFVELFGQPKAFRGKLVTIRGTALQATYLRAGDNSAGIDGYYRVILAPEGGPVEPMFVYALRLPDGFPTGDEIRADVETTGFFFKRMVYPTEQNSELRRAPVIMTRTLAHLQPAATSPPNVALAGVVIAMVVLGVVGLVVALAWTARTSAPRRERTTAALPAIDDRDVIDVNESLDRLSENER